MNQFEKIFAFESMEADKRERVKLAMLRLGGGVKK